MDNPFFNRINYLSDPENIKKEITNFKVTEGRIEHRNYRAMLSVPFLFFFLSLLPFPQL
jgi:hypothetical protein